MRLLITAGGTGGHVYPALAVANKLPPDTTILWVGARGGIERELVARAGLPFEAIHAGAVVGVGAARAAWGALKMGIGTLEAMTIVRRFRPEALFVTGGYTAVPVAAACWLARRPILVYLPDIEPGSAVKWVANFATKVAVTAEQSRAYFQNDRVVVTGYPVRPELAAATRADAARHFGLSADRKTVLVFGGSRGARSINTALMDALDDLLADFEIIHVSGDLDWPAVQARREALPNAKRARYHAFPYLHEDMGLALAAADVVVSRAGASALGEFPMFGLGAILVPYPHAWRYQKVNADFLAARGAAARLNDEDLKTKLPSTLRDLLQDAPRLSAMRAASRALAVPYAAERIASELLRMAARAEGLRR